MSNPTRVARRVSLALNELTDETVNSLRGTPAYDHPHLSFGSRDAEVNRCLQCFLTEAILAVEAFAHEHGHFPLLPRFEVLADETRVPLPARWVDKLREHETIESVLRKASEDSIK